MNKTKIMHTNKSTKILLSLLFFAMLFTETSLAQNPTESEKYHLPYKNTYVKEPLTAENTFRIAEMVTTTPGSFEEAMKILPYPVWEGHEEEIKMYWRAWEIAINNIRAPQPKSGFIASYIDTAYNGNIFMWDSSFILMFARYGARFFPFQQTLDNFYAKQHPDGFICREIKADGADCFERYDPVSTGPNLIPWCEMVYYHQYGDIERLHKVFPVLSAYYKWLRRNRTWRNGTYWSSGWGTGMDNMPRVDSKYSPIFSHGHMIWLDTNLQQLFTANLMLEMGFFTERWQEIEDFEDEAKMLGKYIKKNLWNDKTGFLYDQYADGKLCETMGIGAYWVLYTDVLKKKELDRMVYQLSNSKTFKRPGMVPSLSANHPKYKENGRYWQGGVWPGTNYMVIQGLYQKGYKKQAYDIALKHYNQVFKVFQNTNTFWEYYSPESARPGFMARKDFVGWTGLPPISVLIEFIIGIKADYPKNTIVWDLNLTQKNGIKRYPFGKEGMIDFECEKRRKITEEPKLHIKSNVNFDLIVNYGKKSKKIKVTTDRVDY